MLPDFIIIGAMKCGTSSLHYYLSLHPHIGMSRMKEVDYFVTEGNFDKGAEWYTSQFEGDCSLYGEASPNYSKGHFFQGVPARIHAHRPDVKLIYLVRDPIERIVSHYTHNYGAGREPQSISQALSDFTDNHYVMCSRYYWQLEQYLAYFPISQILVVPSGELKERRAATLQKIFTFLGVEPFETPRYSQMMHRTDTKRRKSRLAWHLLEVPLIKTLKGYAPVAARDTIKRLAFPIVQKPELDAALRKELQAYLKPDTDALRALTGEAFADWSI